MEATVVYTNPFGAYRTESVSILFLAILLKHNSALKRVYTENKHSNTFWIAFLRL